MILKIENNGVIIDEFTTMNLQEAKRFLVGYGATEDLIPMHLLGKVIDMIIFNITEVKQCPF